VLQLGNVKCYELAKRKVFVVASEFHFQYIIFPFVIA